MPSTTVSMLGQYEVGPTIGSGSSSKVKAGKHSETGVEVAIKIVKKGANGNHECQHELDVLTQIVGHAKDRSRIVDVHEVMESSRYMYIVLERVFGGDLFETIVKKALDEETARWVFRDIASAMVELKKCGVAHRDIKPENILVDFSARVAKLSDFGLSKVHPNWQEGEVHLSQARVGTEAYVAPEVISGEQYNAYVSDCWSLGVTMYCALTGRFPSSSCLNFVRGGPAGHLSEELQGLLTALMEVDPEARIKTEDVGRHPWFKTQGTPERATYTVSDEDTSVSSSPFSNRARRTLNSQLPFSP